MPKKVLDKFGQLLIERVRDETIVQWNMVLDGRMKGVRANQLRELLCSMTVEDRAVAMSLIPEVVDSVLHNFLSMFEREDDLKLGMRTDDALLVDLVESSDGLAGELYSDQGWIARFSHEGV